MGSMRDPHATREPDTLVPTATLLWESCRHTVDPEAVRRALAEGADLDLARSCGALSRTRANRRDWEPRNRPCGAWPTP
jgi:hypothetical protein